MKLQKYFNISILFFAISFAFYIIDIYDWFLDSEIFIDLASLLTASGFLLFLIFTIIQIKKTHHLPSKLSILILIMLLTGSVGIYGSRNGMFWGKKIISSRFQDDMSGMDLDLYENGKYTIYSNWMLGENRFEGNYILNGDTIIFTRTPVVENDFIEQKIVIDRLAKKIYFRKEQDGSYDKSFYYFQIDF